MDASLATPRTGIQLPRRHKCICMQYLVYSELGSQQEIFDQNTELAYTQEAPQKATELRRTNCLYRASHKTCD